MGSRLQNDMQYHAPNKVEFATTSPSLFATSNNNSATKVASLWCAHVGNFHSSSLDSSPNFTANMGPSMKCLCHTWEVGHGMGRPTMLEDTNDRRWTYTLTHKYTIMHKASFPHTHTIETHTRTCICTYTWVECSIVWIVFSCVLKSCL